MTLFLISKKNLYNIFKVLIISFILLISATKIIALPTKKNVRETFTAAEFQNKIKVGIDVDWAKTTQGRIAAQNSYNNGINVPEIFKNRGFDHVRIRIKEDIRSDNTEVTGITLKEEVKRLVNQSLEAGLIPIIAYQAKSFKDNPTDKEIKNLIKWWEEVAKTFREYPNLIAYDLIIETTDKVKKHNDKLNEAYKKISKAIREIDDQKIIIVAPNKISNPYELPHLEVPAPHKYTMIEWHFYASGPSQSNQKKKWTTGTLEEKKLITDKINFAKNWSNANKIQTWVGAWAANDYNSHDSVFEDTYYDGAPRGGNYSLNEQINFATFMSKNLQKNNIPYSVISDTKFYNREKNIWYESVSKLLDTMLKNYN